VVIIKLYCDRVLAEQDFKNAQFTTHAPERVGATTNNLGTMATWCSALC
jgi:hypothetical protein